MSENKSVEKTLAIAADDVFIRQLIAREIIDSRGIPTIETDVITDIGVFSASVPSGASTGTHEAVELRDHQESRFHGKGVLQAVNNVNIIFNKNFKGKSVLSQVEIDNKMKELDGTPNKSKLGANAILSVSLAVAKAGAAAKKIPLYEYFGQLADNNAFFLPIPAFNVINGGKHAGNALAFQEFKILPVGAQNFHEALRMGCEVYQTLKNIIAERHGTQATAVGDEGGFSPPISNPYEAMELIMEAIHKSGYHQNEIRLGMDCAASEFYDQKSGLYNLGFKMDQHIKEQYSEKWLERNTEEMMQLYHELTAKYPLITIEDPFHEEAWEDFARFTKGCPSFNCLQVIGDDLLCTNVERMRKAKEYNACNCLLLKPNQIGTVTEAIEAAKLAKSFGWNVMVSHRSGETEDDYIADLAVGLGVGQIKSGAPCRSERLAKYNQLLRIEEHMGKEARYPCGASINFGRW